MKFTLDTTPTGFVLTGLIDPSPHHPEFEFAQPTPENFKPLPPIKPDDVPELEPGWTFAGEDPIICGRYSEDLAACLSDGWDHSGWAGDSGFPYAVRTGSDIHRAQPWFDESQLASNQEKVSSNLGAIPAHLPEPPAPLALGTWLEFLEDEFGSTDEAQGATVQVVTIYASGAIETSRSGNRLGLWSFTSDWREGLEIVEAVPHTPEVAGISDEELGERITDEWSRNSDSGIRSMAKLGAFARELLTGKAAL